MKKEMTYMFILEEKKKAKWGCIKNIVLDSNKDLQCTTFTLQEKKKTTRTPQKLSHIFLFGLVK